MSTYLRSVAIALVSVLLASSSVVWAQVTDGAIVVQKFVVGNLDASGFEFTLVSNDPVNCPLPPITTSQYTSADGQTTFSGLYARSAAGIECTYSLQETPKEGYVLGTGQDFSRLSPGTTVESTSTALSVASNGTFSNPSKNPEANGTILEIQCLEGEGTSLMRAGRNPFTDICFQDSNDKSGIGYAPLDNPSVPLGTTPIGIFTHYNRTIERGFNNADMELSVTFSDPVSGQSIPYTAQYRVVIDETKDSGSPVNGIPVPPDCPYPGPNGWPDDISNPGGYGCADQIVLSPVDPPSSITVGGVDVYVQLAMVPANAGECDFTATPTNTVYTQERTNSDFCLFVVTKAAEVASTSTVTVTNTHTTPVVLTTVPTVGTSTLVVPTTTSPLTTVATETTPIVTTVTTVTEETNPTVVVTETVTELLTTEISNTVTTTPVIFAEGSTLVVVPSTVDSVTTVTTETTPILTTVTTETMVSKPQITSTTLLSTQTSSVLLTTTTIVPVANVTDTTTVTLSTTEVVGKMATETTTEQSTVMQQVPVTTTTVFTQTTTRAVTNTVTSTSTVNSLVMSTETTTTNAEITSSVVVDSTTVVDDTTVVTSTSDPTSQVLGVSGSSGNSESSALIAAASTILFSGLLFLALGSGSTIAPHWENLLRSWGLLPQVVLTTTRSAHSTPTQSVPGPIDSPNGRG